MTDFLITALIGLSVLTVVRFIAGPIADTPLVKALHGGDDQ